MHGLAFKSDKEVALNLNVSIRIPTPEKYWQKRQWRLYFLICKTGKDDFHLSFCE